MRIHVRIVKLLAALLAVYAAAVLLRLQGELKEAGDRIEALTDACAETEAAIEARQREIASADSDEAVSRRAFTQLGLVAPDDIIFFDDG